MGLSSGDSDTLTVVVRFGVVTIVFLLFLWWQFKAKQALPPKRFVANLEAVTAEDDANDAHYAAGKIHCLLFSLLPSTCSFGIMCSLLPLPRPKFKCYNFLY